MTALGIGTFSVKDPLFSPVIALFATACSYYWFRTNLGSKFWQESWEVEVTELSKELGVRSFERPLGEVREQVRRSLATGQAAEKRSLIRRWIDHLTVRKYSVTYNMILLSLVSTVVWFLVAMALVLRSLSGAVEDGGISQTQTIATPPQRHDTPRSAPPRAPAPFSEKPGTQSRPQSPHSQNIDASPPRAKET
jgi:hypothetical protein